MFSQAKWNGLLVYTPDSPNIAYLNGTCWLAMEFADGREPGSAEAEFVRFVSDIEQPQRAALLFQESVATLERYGIIERVVKSSGEV